MACSQSGCMQHIVSHLCGLRAPRLLIWPLKTSVTSDHCCFVMLHREPRGSEQPEVCHLYQPVFSRLDPTQIVSVLVPE